MIDDNNKDNGVKISGFGVAIEAVGKRGISSILLILTLVIGIGGLGYINYKGFGDVTNLTWKIYTLNDVNVKLLAHQHEMQLYTAQLDTCISIVTKKAEFELIMNNWNDNTLRKHCPFMMPKPRPITIEKETP